MSCDLYEVIMNLHKSTIYDLDDLVIPSSITILDFNISSTKISNGLDKFLFNLRRLTNLKILKLKIQNTRVTGIQLKILNQSLKNLKNIKIIYLGLGKLYVHENYILNLMKTLKSKKIESFNICI